MTLLFLLHTLLTHSCCTIKLEMEFCCNQWFCGSLYTQSGWNKNLMLQLIITSVHSQSKSVYNYKD